MHNCNYIPQVRFFYTSGQLATFDAANLNVWENMAGLTIFGRADAEVHHVVSGNISATILNTVPNSPAAVTFVARIIDEENRIICSKVLRYVVPQATINQSVLVPFTFQCFDELPESGSVTLRLEAELTEATGIYSRPTLQDIDWSATVFNNIRG